MKAKVSARISTGQPQLSAVNRKQHPQHAKGASPEQHSLTHGKGPASLNSFPHCCLSHTLLH